MMLILIAIYLGSMLSGGPDVSILISQQVRDRVQVEIVDKAKAEAVLADMDSIEEAGAAIREDLLDDLKRWAKEDEDHAVGRQSFETVVAKSMDKRAVARENALDAFFAMKSKMTQKQWEAVFKEKTSD